MFCSPVPMCVFVFEQGAEGPSTTTLPTQQATLGPQLDILQFRSAIIYLETASDPTC